MWNTSCKTEGTCGLYMQEEIVLAVVIEAWWEVCWAGNKDAGEDLILPKLILGNSNFKIFLSFVGIGESSKLYAV